MMDISSCEHAKHVCGIDCVDIKKCEQYLLLEAKVADFSSTWDNVAAYMRSFSSNGHDIDAIRHVLCVVEEYFRFKWTEKLYRCVEGSLQSVRDRMRDTQANVINRNHAKRWFAGKLPVESNDKRLVVRWIMLRFMALAMDSAYDQQFASDTMKLLVERFNQRYAIEFVNLLTEDDSNIHYFTLAYVDVINRYGYSTTAGWLPPTDYFLILTYLLRFGGDLLFFWAKKSVEGIRFLRLLLCDFHANQSIFRTNSSGEFQGAMSRVHELFLQANAAHSAQTPSSSLTEDNRPPIKFAEFQVLTPVGELCRKSLPLKVGRKCGSLLRPTWYLPLDLDNMVDGWQFMFRNLKKRFESLPRRLSLENEFVRMLTALTNNSS